MAWLCPAPLSACGFSPVYGTGPAAANSGPISIPEIAGPHRTFPAPGTGAHGRPRRARRCRVGAARSDAEPEHRTSRLCARPGGVALRLCRRRELAAARSERTAARFGRRHGACELQLRRRRLCRPRGADGGAGAPRHSARPLDPRPGHSSRRASRAVGGRFHNRLRPHSPADNEAGGARALAFCEVAAGAPAHRADLRRRSGTRLDMQQTRWRGPGRRASIRSTSSSSPTTTCAAIRSCWRTSSLRARCSAATGSCACAPRRTRATSSSSKSSATSRRAL